MIDRTFSSAITLCLLAVAAVAICGLIIGGPAGLPASQQHAQAELIELPRMVITAKRLAAAPAATPTAGDDRSSTAVALAD